MFIFASCKSSHNLNSLKLPIELMGENLISKKQTISKNAYDWNK